MHTPFVRQIAKDDKADEANDTLMINFRNARNESGNVAFALCTARRTTLTSSGSTRLRKAKSQWTYSIRACKSSSTK
jgi:hypothetical protein